MLFKKNLYSLAISLAQCQDLGEEGLINIFTQYADHLYSKADYDAAISQYIRTIGHLEPSRVIRRVSYVSILSFSILLLIQK